jgi:hypothetical protein
MQALSNVDDIRKDIEDQGHTIINKWNIKKQATRKVLSMFHVELKLEINNKNIHEIRLHLHCKIKVIIPKT